MRPQRLRIVGPFRGATGYDHHTREFARALSSLGCDVHLVDVPEWSPSRLPDDRRDPWFEDRAAPASAPRPSADATIHFLMPPQFRPEPATVNLLYTMFEAPRVPAHWALSAARADLLVVPTASSESAFTTAFAEVGRRPPRLARCPLGVDSESFRPGLSPLPLVTREGRPVADYATRFLNVSEWSARKNIDDLLRAWLRATQVGDDTVLLLKLRFFDAETRGRFLARREAIAAEVGRDWSRAAPVVLYEGLLSDADMPRVYATASHYVSVSHGEGWDQSMTEAAASGLRLIAPRHSAYLEYLDDSTATWLEARLVPAQAASDPWIGSHFEGQDWWQIDPEALVALLRQENARPPGIAPTGARARMQARYSWPRSARRLLDLIDERMASR